MQLDLFSMRWNNKKSSYRPSSEPFDKSRFSVEKIEENKSKEFVTQHHYSGSFPAAISSYGLIERTGFHQFRLAGCAVFSVPIQPAAAGAYGARGIPFCDLGRFVLLDEVGGNAESWFLSRSLKQLNCEKRDDAGNAAHQVIMAYSDPVPRTDIHGGVTHSGHYGGIYHASNAIYRGRSNPRSLWLAPNGTIISERALSKLRRDDTGSRYAYEMLISHGAPIIRPGESGSDYVRRSLADGPFRRLRHKGNHAFLIPAGNHSQRQKLRKNIAHIQQIPTIEV